MSKDNPNLNDTDFFSEEVYKEAERRKQMADEALITAEPQPFDIEEFNMGSPTEMENPAYQNAMENIQFEKAKTRMGSPTSMPGAPKLDALMPNQNDSEK